MVICPLQFRYGKNFSKIISHENNLALEQPLPNWGKKRIICKSYGVICFETYYKYDNDILEKKSHRNIGGTWDTITTIEKISGNTIIEKTEIRKDSYEYQLRNQNGFLIKKIEINPFYTESTFTIDEKY